MLDLARFPEYFRGYQWEAKHSVFGYPRDRFPEFCWISNLEDRGAWLRGHLATGAKNSGLYFLKDVIQWGGSQNGVLQKLEDRLGNACLADQMSSVVQALPDTRTAIDQALQLPGLGLTYGSKLLRFLDPVRYGALDSRLRAALNTAKPNDTRFRDMPNINDNNSSAVTGYVWFCSFVSNLLSELERLGIGRPGCALQPNPATHVQWRAADVEMALFQWAAAGTDRAGAAGPEGTIPPSGTDGDFSREGSLSREDVVNILDRQMSDDHSAWEREPLVTREQRFTMADIDRNHRRIEEEIIEGVRRAGSKSKPQR